MKKALRCLVLIGAVALTAWPATTEATNCGYGYQYCTQYYCAPDDQQCLTGCECGYLNCIGAELPSWCIY